MIVGLFEERDAREVDGNGVVRQELGERPGCHAGQPDGVGVRRRSERERDRELVGADGVRAVTVVPLAEVTAQPVVDDRAKLLHRVKHLPGRATALAAQRDPSAVPRPGGRRW